MTSTLKLKGVKTITTPTELQEGMNAILIPTDTPIGSFIAGNNLRGFATKNANVCVGMVSDYAMGNVYVIVTDNLASWRFAKKI